MPKADVSVTVVWLSMLEGDDATAARKASRMFSDPRVRQFFDPGRIISLTFVRDVFPTCLHDLLESTPKDHPLHATLEEWAASESKPRPVWDAVLFFDRDTEWGEHAPSPARWSKQLAFHGSASPGKPSVLFYRDNCKSPPVESDWYLEVRNGMNALGAKHVSEKTHEPPVELLGFPSCPNTPTIRKSLEAALASLGSDAKIVDVNLEGLPRNDRRRRWGAPTILVNGRDLMGLPPSAGHFLSCRVYPDGLPTAVEIVRRLKASPN